MGGRQWWWRGGNDANGKYKNWADITRIQAHGAAKYRVKRESSLRNETVFIPDDVFWAGSHQVLIRSALINLYFLFSPPRLYSRNQSIWHFPTWPNSAYNETKELNKLIMFSFRCAKYLPWIDNLILRGKISGTDTGFRSTTISSDWGLRSTSISSDQGHRRTIISSSDIDDDDNDSDSDSDSDNGRFPSITPT